MSAGTRKYGRNKKRPAQLRYVASGRCAKNKAAKIAKHNARMSANAARRAVHDAKKNPRRTSYT